MNTVASAQPAVEGAYPLRLEIPRAASQRNRLTTAFRLLLGIPHILLVGGPLAAGLGWMWNPNNDQNWGLTSSGGALGAVAGVCALIAWFAILFTSSHPEGLWNLAAFYLRWRVRAVAYLALLRDEYPPFGEAPYPVLLELRKPAGARDRLSVGLRIILAIPHLLAMCVLGVAWMVTTAIAWFAILLTGRYPGRLYDFATGVMRWSTRVEAYLLLLHDDYPPFSFQ